MGPATLSPSALAFTELATPQTLTITNAGSTALSIQAIQISSAAYAETNNCGSSLAAGASCSVHVSVTLGTAPLATLAVIDDASTGPQVVNLSFTPPRTIDFGHWAIGTTASLSVDIHGVGSAATTLYFSNIPIGTVSAPQTVTINAYENHPIQASLASTFGGGPQPFVLPGPSSCASTPCTLSIAYAPTSATDSGANVYVIATDTVGLSSGNIQAYGQVAPPPFITYNPASLTFAAEALNTVSAPQTVTFTNSGTTVLTLLFLVAPYAGDYGLSNHCPASLAINAACTVDVRFAPISTTGTLSSNLVIDGTSPSAAPRSSTAHPTPVSWLLLLDCSAAIGQARRRVQSQRCKRHPRAMPPARPRPVAAPQVAALPASLAEGYGAKANLPTRQMQPGSWRPASAWYQAGPAHRPRN